MPPGEIIHRRDIERLPDKFIIMPFINACIDVYIPEHGIYSSARLITAEQVKRL